MNEKRIEQVPLRITRWIGSGWSLVVHTILFIGIFVLRGFGVPLGDVLLILTTAVSLEAIYLSIFIQMSVNRNTESLLEVEEDIDEIQEDVEGIEKDIDEIQEDIDEIEEDDAKEIEIEKKQELFLENISTQLKNLMADIETLKKK